MVTASCIRSARSHRSRRTSTPRACERRTASRRRATRRARRVFLAHVAHGPTTARFFPSSISTQGKIHRRIR
jgi:hypothetical protein